jgi:hypothetical protein
VTVEKRSVSIGGEEIVSLLERDVSGLCFSGHVEGRSGATVVSARLDVLGGMVRRATLSGEFVSVIGVSRAWIAEPGGTFEVVELSERPVSINDDLPLRRFPPEWWERAGLNRSSVGRAVNFVGRAAWQFELSGSSNGDIPPGRFVVDADTGLMLELTVLRQDGEIVVGRWKELFFRSDLTPEFFERP